MLIYFALLFMVTVATYLSQRMKDKVISSLMGAIAFIALVLVSGLRSRYVGTDASGYVYDFERISELADIWKFQIEPGLPFLFWVSKFISNDYIVAFAVVAIIITVCFLIGIRKLSVNPSLSAFVLLTSGTFTFHFNGMRQGIAIAILFLALGAIYQRKFWVFLLCVAFASLFHISALVTLPAYFIVPQQNKFRYNLLIFSLAIVSFVMFSDLLNIAGKINPKYLSYGETVPGRGLLSSAFLGTLGIFFLYFKRHIIEHRVFYEFLLNLYLLGLVVVGISGFKQLYPSGFLRLSGYFVPVQILLWPIVFANLQKSRDRTLLLAAFVIFGLVYYGMSLQRFSNLVPYSFNPLVQEWLSTIL